jgi:hypothetical protein
MRNADNDLQKRLLQLETKTKKQFFTNAIRSDQKLSEANQIYQEMKEPEKRITGIC